MDTIIVMYSFEMLEKSPSKNPLGLVVVKPTLMFSDIVDLHIPSNSYLIIELALRFTPISKIKQILNTKHSSRNISIII